MAKKKFLDEIGAKVLTTLLRKDIKAVDDKIGEGFEALTEDEINTIFEATKQNNTTAEGGDGTSDIGTDTGGGTNSTDGESSV